MRIATFVLVGLVACGGGSGGSDSDGGGRTTPGGGTTGGGGGGGGGGLVDLDADGFRDDVDCDDQDPDVHPGAEETAYDGVDNDCDPSTLDDDLDQDGVLGADDCDDLDASVYPGAAEVAGDGVDNDCDPGTCFGAGFADSPSGWALPGDDFPEDRPFYGLGARSYCDYGVEQPAFSTLDLTGDGLLDLVVTTDCADPRVGASVWRVYEGDGSGFAPDPVDWAIPGAAYAEEAPFFGLSATSYCDYGVLQPAFSTTDLDGDGRPDLVVTIDCDDRAVGEQRWDVYRNTGSGFASSPDSWSVPGDAFAEDQPFFGLGASSYCDYGVLQPAFSMTDLDGDGRPDLVVTTDCNAPAVGERRWDVYANTGSGFAGSPDSWSVPGDAYAEDQPFFGLGASAYCDYGVLQPAFSTVDLTGDGMLDLVVTTDCGDAAVGEGRWDVYANTGSGFASSPDSWSVPGNAYAEDQPFFGLGARAYCDYGVLQPAFSTVDLTGDGRPDLVVTTDCNAPAVGEGRWDVYANTGTGFSGSPEGWGVPGGAFPEDRPFFGLGASSYCDYGVLQPAFSTVDLTGDGLLDLAVTFHCDDAGVGETRWSVYEATCDL